MAKTEKNEDKKAEEKKVVEEKVVKLDINNPAHGNLTNEELQNVKEK